MSGGQITTSLENKLKFPHNNVPISWRWNPTALMSYNFDLKNSKPGVIIEFPLITFDVSPEQISRDFPKSAY